jgi:hypothetical protein
MQIELNDDLQAALEKKAAEACMSVSSYASFIVQEQLREDTLAAPDRSNAIDGLIEHVKTSNATSGRKGREWREFIHEGHRD